MRRRIIEGAASVLRDRGVAATGLEEIRAETGTSSSQLFHYFPGGKTELMLAVAAYEADQILAEQQPHLDRLTSWDSWQAWAEQLFAHYEQQREHCGLSALTSQLDPNDPAVREIIVVMYRRWTDALSAGIRSMQADGEIDPELDAGQTASALLAGVQGGVVMMLATGSPEHLRAALDTGLERLGVPSRSDAGGPGAKRPGASERQQLSPQPDPHR
jgi:AcrR family transcriptional regulator